MIASTTDFRFRRYREEVALRSLQQCGETGNVSADSTLEHAVATNQINIGGVISPPGEGDDNGDDDGIDDGTVIQNLSDGVIIVDAFGKVSTKKKNADATIAENNGQSGNDFRTRNDDENNISHQNTISFIPGGTTLLLRNLRDCRVVIHLPLPAVHFVGIENTDITFFNRYKVNNVCNDTHCNQSSQDPPHTPVAPTSLTQGNSNTNTTIHMTECLGRSSLELETSAQQLRIHKSIGLRVKMMDETGATTREGNFHLALPFSTTSPSCDWKPGTIILESSKDIVFSVPPMVEASPARQPQDEEGGFSLNTVATTQTYWHQVIVKDFQWLRKGIASPNFQIQVLEVRNHDVNKKNNSKNSGSMIVESDLHAEEFDTDNDSDSDDEL